MIDWKYKINLGIESLKNVIKNEELDVMSKYGIIYACELLKKLVPKVTIKNDKWFFNLMVDDYYNSAFDFFKKNKDVLVEIAKLNKDKLKGFDLTDETGLVSELVDIYSSDSDLFNEWIELRYSDKEYFTLIDYDEHYGEFRVRVWKYEEVK